MGDGRAERFSALYTAQYPPVLAYCRRRLDEDGARDVAAQVFLVAWRRFDELPADPLPWLLQAAGLTVSAQGRGERRRHRLTARVASVDRLDDVVDPADRVVEQDAVLSALGHLRPADRELLMLSAWEDLDPAAIAVVLDCSAGAARVRLHRARRRLRAVLRDEPPPPAHQPARQEERT